jgi:hypothetical protein
VALKEAMVVFGFSDFCLSVISVLFCLDRVCYWNCCYVWLYYLDQSALVILGIYFI